MCASRKRAMEGAGVGKLMSCRTVSQTANELIIIVNVPVIC